MYAIYALIDPRDNTVHYVGATDDVYRRFQEHINCCGRNFAKNAWILELRMANRMLVMKTLEEVESTEEAKVQEAYWIKHFEMLGESITNSHKVEKSFPRRDTSSLEKREGLWRALDAYQPEMSCRQLARILGVSPPTAGARIRRLKTMGLISQSGQKTAEELPAELD